MKRIRKKHPIFAAAVSYVLTIISTRALLLLAEKTSLPNTIFDINHVHIHHFVLGIALMIIIAFFNIFSPISKHKAAIGFGIALALIIDEFSIWLKLNDGYWSGLNLIAILTITAGFISFITLTYRRKKRMLVHFPKTSVVIPAFNEAKRIGKTLRSLKNQNYRGKIEIIVVDNNSNDQTAEVARKFGAIVVSEMRKGVSYCRQTGFMRATGAIIATTDADTIVPKYWVQRLVEEFEKHPSAVAVTGMYNFYDGIFVLRYGTAIFAYPLFWVFKWYSGANLAIKKSAFLAVGGFDEDINLSEDTDICNRLKKIGEVYRLPFLVVQTSARRFNQLGLLGGAWDYWYTYFRLKTSSNKAGVRFRSASEIPKLGFFPKLAINLIVFAIIIIIIGISPVRAEILEQEKRLHLHRPSNILHYNQIIHRIHHGK